MFLYICFGELLNSNKEAYYLGELLIYICFCIICSGSSLPEPWRCRNWYNDEHADAAEREWNQPGERERSG